MIKTKAVMILHPFSKTVFLIGAGISIDHPSCIPAAHPILKCFAQWLAEGDSELEARLMSSYFPDKTHNPFDSIRFEALIQQVAFFAPEILRIISAIEKHGEPNAHHHFLIDALNQGATIITTNFDTRLEKAAETNGVDSRLFTLSRKRKFPPTESRLIKIHGTFPHKKQNHCLPRATLNQIGSIGLAFDRFPAFCRWFETVTTGATLYVLGYSASDSFDVVPLLEEHCRADRVEWFEFQPSVKTMKEAVIQRGNIFVLPEDKTDDFPLMTLERMKATGVHHVRRIIGSSLGRFLSIRFGGLYDGHYQRLNKDNRDNKWSKAKDENLEALGSGLQSLELEPEIKTHICNGLLKDGAFGQTYTDDGEDEEYTPIDSALYREVRELIDNKRFDEASLRLDRVPDRERDNAFNYARAIVELEQEHIKEGFAQLRDTMQESAEDDPQLEMMLADAEFNKFLHNGNLPEMRRVRAMTRDRARKSGILWGLILHDSMAARECEWRLINEGTPAAARDRVIEKGLRYSGRYAYFALRTGRYEWFFPAVRLHAYFLTTVLRYQETEEVLRRLLVWIGDASIEDYGVTLANMITLSLYRNDVADAKKYLRNLGKVSDDWTLKPLFYAIAAADIARIQGKLKVATRHLALAEELLGTLSPDDPWDQTRHIKRLKEAFAR